MLDGQWGIVGMLKELLKLDSINYGSCSVWNQ